MRILRYVIGSALLALLAAPRVHAGALRIALLANAEVRGDAILLANLLGPGTPKRIQEAAQNIVLGETPQNGTARRFSRESLAAAIGAGGLPASDFSIPDAVTVRRWGRLISRDEVFAAIQAASAKNPAADFPYLQPQDISFEAEVRVPPGDAGLEVTQIKSDPFVGRARVRLWPRSARGVLPFYVSVRVRGDASESSAPLATHFVPASSRATENSISSPVLVSPNRPARLRLHSANLDMLLDVRPLESGRLGDVVRVRLLGTGRTVRAAVASEAYLDATL
jgi:hypothetical protein